MAARDLAAGRRTDRPQQGRHRNRFGKPRDEQALFSRRLFKTRRLPGQRNDRERARWRIALRTHLALEVTQTG
ncbi:MAG: hypothetical protein V4793_03460, partial [Paraburkholderia tropica]